MKKHWLASTFLSRYESDSFLYWPLSCHFYSLTGSFPVKTLNQCWKTTTEEVLLNTFHMQRETAIIPVRFSDCVPACALLTVNVQMVVGGCRLTLLACTLCTPALSDLAAWHFDWSHFCQTRQAKTHLGIQGAPADESPTCTHDYPDEVPGNLPTVTVTISWPWPTGSCHNSYQRHHERLPGPFLVCPFPC